MFRVSLVKPAIFYVVKLILCNVKPPTKFNTRNINLTVNTAKQFHMACPLDGEMTVETDASLTFADVADALSLPSIPFKVVKRATDKIKMRQILQKKRPIVFFTIFFKALGGFGVLELVNFNEQTKRLLCIFSGFCHPDIMDILFCFGRTILVI